MKGNINNKYFVYLGNAYPHKNLTRLIEAIVKLNKQSLANFVGKNGSNIVKLKISSSRSVFTDRLLKIIKDKAAEQYVDFLGYVKDEDINKLYKNSLSFVFPTLSEGFGLPPKEAIESDTFAIVSDIPVLKEVYKNSVLYFDPKNIDSIVKTMEEVVKMPESVRQEKIKYAQKFLKRYSWKKMVEETLKIYESI